MIYNENGMIINEEFILDNYINHPFNIHENFNDAIYFVKSKVITVLQNMANSILNVIDWLTNLPNRNKIKNNKNDILKALNNQKDIIMKCKLSEYLSSDGYGKWIANFKNACNKINMDLSISVEEVVSTLYENSNKDSWFIKNDGSISIKSIDMNNIIDIAISTKDNINKLRESYKSITEINKKLSRNEKIDIQIINELQNYYFNAIKSFRSLSVHSIKLCLKALNGDISSYKFSDVENVIDEEDEIDEEKKYIEMVKNNPESIKDIDNPSEKVQMAAIKADYNIFKYIKNPTKNVMYEAVKLHDLLIGDIYDPPERVQMVAVKNNPYAINSIKPYPCEKAKAKAVLINYKVLEYIDNPSEKIQMSALQSNLDAFNYIKNPCQKAINYYNRHKEK